MINVNNLKPGLTFQENKDIFVVIEAQHSQQGRGQASVKAKVKDLRTGSIIVKSYTGGDKVTKAHINKIDMGYLYNDGENVVLMDNVTYEQIEIPVSKLQNQLKFIKDEMKVVVRKFEDNEILDIELPNNVEYKVIEAPDAVKGNTANNPSKFVTIETGLKIEAPMFVKNGENIIVSTETGKYMGRGSK